MDSFLIFFHENFQVFDYYFYEILVTVVVLILIDVIYQFLFGIISNLFSGWR